MFAVVWWLRIVEIQIFIKFWLLHNFHSGKFQRQYCRKISFDANLSGPLCVRKFDLSKKCVKHIRLF